MIDFSKPVRFRGRHAAYAQFLSTERGSKREGGVNIFRRIMDCYMVSILVGLKHNRTAEIDDSVILVKDIFGENVENANSKITSSDINAETIHASQIKLNYIYKIVMLTEKKRGLSDDEKIANAFKYDNNAEKVEKNLELMNSYARGGLEILYQMFDETHGETEIINRQLELFDSMIENQNEEIEHREDMFFSIEDEDCISGINTL